MKSPSVTLLVLNHNGIQYLKGCLDSIMATEYPNFEAIVIDNASLDGSGKFVRKNYPQVRLIQNEKNLGFANAYNLVLGSINSEYVALLNSDIEVETDWLGKLLFHLEKNENVAAANPKMLFLQDKKRINAAGGNCDIYGTGWNRGNGEFDDNQYDKIEEVFYGTGAAILIKRKAWQTVGPFDERYFLYGEDLDWCWRARLKGYKILYVPEAKIYHRWKGSNGTIIPFLERHWLTTLLKNYSLKTLSSVMPKYLTLKMLEASWLMRHGKTLDEKFAVFKSFSWNLRNLNDTWKKRVSSQLDREISDKELQTRMHHSSFEFLLWLGKIKHPIIDDTTLG